jgi:hypothetical protein
MADLSEHSLIPGQVPILINHQFALTIEDLSVKRTRASAVRSGFAGNFGKSKGIYQYSFSFKMPPLVVGYEIDLSVLAEPFTLTYRLGNVEFSLNGAEVNDDSLAVAQQAGSTGSDFNGNALNRTPV